MVYTVQSVFIQSPQTYDMQSSPVWYTENKSKRLPSLDKLVSVRRRYAAHSSHLEFGMCLGQEPTHCHTWHVHFHLSRWRCGQGESNICINQAGNWHSDARARAVRARRKFWRFSSKVSKRSKATRRQKSSKWSKALGLLAEANISQKWS